MSQWNFRQPSLIPQIDEVPNPASDHQQAEDSNQPSENSRAHIEPPTVDEDDCFSPLGVQSKARL